jgi:hypothetical protein
MYVCHADTTPTTTHIHTMCVCVCASVRVHVCMFYGVRHRALYMFLVNTTLNPLIYLALIY